MGKGKTAQRSARLAASVDTKPKFISVKLMESYTKPSGSIGCRTRWEKVSKEVWDKRWGVGLR